MKMLDLSNPFSDAPVYYREVTGSTMEDSKNDSSRGISHGTVYMSGFQTKGRGRIKGRTWASDSSLNLMFTIVFKRDSIIQDLNLIPLIIGTALAQSVRSYTALNFNLKWPNDLLYNGKKISGILCEADSQYIYCGMGINCNQTSWNSKDLENKVTSLSLCIGKEIDLNNLLEQILIYIKYYLNSGELWREELESLLYKKGEEVEILAGRAGDSTTIKGRIVNIGEEGQLLIENRNGEITEIYAGEIEL